MCPNMFATLTFRRKLETLSVNQVCHCEYCWLLWLKQEHNPHSQLVQSVFFIICFIPSSNAGMDARQSWKHLREYGWSWGLWFFPSSLLSEQRTPAKPKRFSYGCLSSTILQMCVPSFIQLSIQPTSSTKIHLPTSLEHHVVWHKPLFSLRQAGSVPI